MIDTHKELADAEAAALAPTAWERWADKAEAIFGHSLDGDEPSGDNYSMDSAYEAYKANITPEAYVSTITYLPPSW